jgi:diadenosine tetraphosphatase ApaH/serine/threonine PP2A family protein phosphatase
MGIACVAGNHDLASTLALDATWFSEEARGVAMWTAENLSRVNFEYLAWLPTRLVRPDYEIMHGLPEDVSYYIMTARDASVAFDEMTRPLGFYGHTHIATYFMRDADTAFSSGKAASIGREIEIKRDESLLLNPGSVGQPRDGDPRASYAVYYPDEKRIEIKRIEYDLFTAQEKIREARLPEFFADRLEIGR